VDAIVTTTGGIEEDLIKCLADTYRDELSLPDVALRLKGLNRIYILLVPNSNYCKFQDWVIPIFDQMFEEQKTKNVLWTPSKVIARLGKEINYESSYLYWAYKNDIPVFCPALTDGSLGDLLYYHLFRNPGLVVDIVQDYAVFINTAQEFDGSDSGASPDESPEAVKETEVTAKARSMMFKESQSFEGTCAKIQGYHSMIGTSDLGDSIQ
ncbi:deoxyhypusine synthase, partial [Tanacetum coccineum]